jgi:predicted RNA-binding Zn-ribbon protein involved in translation (DUF1610 family)
MKFFAIIGSLLLTALVLFVLFMNALLFYLSYKVVSEESIFIGVICFGLSSLMLLICIVFGIKHIVYLKANFRKCTCGNRIHSNTSLGGTKYVRFTCIDCGESKWIEN